MKAVLFVDHEIGYRLLEKVLKEKPLDVLAIVTTQENGQHWWKGVEDLAKNAALPFHRFDPKDADVFSQYSDADYFFLLSWKHLMSDALIAIPQKGTVNLHYSLLPKYRGVYPVNWALINNEKETGVTYHMINADIDCGSNIVQRSLNIAPTDTARSLQQKLDDLAFDLFDDLLDVLQSGKNIDADEAAHTPDGVYYSAQKFKGNNEIDLNADVKAGDFLNYLRGKTFLPEGRNAYFTDPDTDKKIYVSLVLEEE